MNAPERSELAQAARETVPASSPSSLKTPSLSNDTAALREAVTICVLLTAGFFLRLVFFTGPIGSDDSRYLEFAESFVRLQPFDAVDHAAGRLVFLVLVGIPYVLGGFATSAALANVVYGLLVDVVCVLIAYRMLGRPAAVVVAALMALNGVHMTYTSMVLPDTLLTLFMLLSVATAHRAHGSPRFSRRLVTMGLAGLLAGLAYGCKETAVVLLPPIAAYFFFFPAARGLRERLVPFAVFLGGFAAYWILDALVYLLLTGDPLYKFTSTAAKHNQGRPSTTSLFEHLRAATAHLNTARHVWQEALVPLFLGVPAMLAAALLRPNRRLYAFVGLFSLAYLIYGTSSFSSFVLLPFQPRYLQPIIPFAAICVASFLYPRPGHEPSTAKRIVAPTLLGGLVLAAALSGASRNVGRLYESGTYTQASLAVRTLAREGRTFYVDGRIARDLPHFLPPGVEADIERIPREGPLPSGYYMLHPRRGRIGVSAERQAAIENLPVRLHLALDTRLIRRFTPGSRYRPETALLVRFKEAGGESAEAPRLRVTAGGCEVVESTVRCSVAIRNDGPSPASGFFVTYGPEGEEEHLSRKHLEPIERLRQVRVRFELPREEGSPPPSRVAMMIHRSKNDGEEQTTARPTFLHVR